MPRLGRCVAFSACGGLFFHAEDHLSICYLIRRQPGHLDGTRFIDLHSRSSGGYTSIFRGVQRVND